MRIQKMGLTHFTRHNRTVLELPPNGIVAITGGNGSGKSSVVEAVATAGWGETLRGASPWRDGVKGSVELQAAEVMIRRSRVGAKTVLEWSEKKPLDLSADPPPYVYETVTKSQEALEAVIGPFNVWRRTCVFSSQDAAHFTMSTDSERKRLLESILNLARFEPALEKCKVDRKAIEEKHLSFTTALAALKAKLESEQHRLRDVEEVVASLPAPLDTTSAKAQLATINRALTDITADSGKLTAARREEIRAVAAADAAAHDAARRLAALGASHCDKCGQPIPTALVEKLKQSAGMATQAAAAAHEKAARSLEDSQAALDELTEEREAFLAKQSELTARLNAEKAAEDRRQLVLAQQRSAREAVTSLEGRIANGEGQLKEAARDLGELQATELVLGLKGVRAHVLGKTLSGVEGVANSWLSRIAGPGLTLALKPYSEKKSGGVSDAISLEVSGAGGGFGYKAASGGERRRLDVALLLALAEVAQAAHQRASGSTLFFDECMDSLDRDGIVAVSSALRELAETRCVVVITHDVELLEELKPVLHLEAWQGLLRPATLKAA